MQLREDEVTMEVAAVVLAGGCSWAENSDGEC